MDGGNLVAEQLYLNGTTPFVRWHHRDPLNLVARDTDGSSLRNLFAVTPNGAQIQTSDGVNLNQYYACLLGGNNNPTCTGFTPQPASAYGYLADQANGMVGASLKVDGVLTLWSLKDIQRRTDRSGVRPESIGLASGLGEAPLLPGTGSVGAGGVRVKQQLQDIFSWNDRGESVTAAGGEIFELVPGNNNGESGPGGDLIKPTFGTYWRPNLGLEDATVNKFEKSFAEIQTDLCRKFFENMVKELTGKDIKFDDLLRSTRFNYYNPAAFKGKYTDVTTDVPSTASAFTERGSNRVFLTGGFNSFNVNGGRLIVHELFHRAGILTKKGFIRLLDDDPIDKLDGEIKKNCSPNSKGI